MSGPVDKATLKRLAEARLAEARCLLDNEHWSGAYYLAGYAVELSLKACVASQFRESQIPSRQLVQSIFSHELSQLLALAQLKEIQASAADESPEFQKNWNFVKNWKETSRYEIIDKGDAKANGRSNRTSDRRSFSMDLSALVEGGVESMTRVVDALEANSVEVHGAYLIKTTADDTGYEDFVFCIVTPRDQRAVLNQIIDLKRAKKLPRFDEKVRFATARPSSMEASRIMAYAAQVGRPTLTIQGVGLDGLYVEDAIVVKWAKNTLAAA